MKVRLLAHRWFANGGAGWAYHPELRPSLMACRLALKDEVHGDLSPVGPFEVPGTPLVLVGIRTADPDRATDDYDRPLAVLRAAALPGRPDAAGQEELRRLLHDRAVPAHPGADAALELDWSGPITPLRPPAAPPAPPRRLRRRLAWVAAGALGLAVLGGLALGRLPVASQAPPPPAQALVPSGEKDTAPARAAGLDLADREQRLNLLMESIDGAQKLPELKRLLEETDAGQWPPERAAVISQAVRNRCNTYFLENARENPSNGKDDRKVKVAVGLATDLLDMADLVQTRLGPRMNEEEAREWTAFRADVEEAIDRLCYSRVRSCREELAKQINNSDTWRDALHDLDLSLEWYDHTKSPPKGLQGTLGDLRQWCDRMMTDTEYEITVCNLPEGWYVLDIVKDPPRQLRVGNGLDVKITARRQRADQLTRPTFSPNLAISPPKVVQELGKIYLHPGNGEGKVTLEGHSIRVECPLLKLPDCREFPEAGGQAGPAPVPLPGGSVSTEPRGTPRGVPPGDPPTEKKATPEVLKEIDAHFGQGEGKPRR